ncbi:MAG: hypothetical protein COA88_07285 [Kordia sp.]|nr:MAG: hypothetical protein COA88_07285 [Kordia sp.]
MKFSQKEVKCIIEESLDKLFKHDAVLLKRDYDINERAISHRLAIHIESIVKSEELDVDVEYNRMRENNCEGTDVGNLIAKRFNWEKAGEGSSFVYPDIIVHKRDTSLNVIEIEIKMAWKNSKKQYDYEKINEYIDQLNYQHGIYIEISDKRENCLIEFGPFDLNES